jgi:muconolactone delta-isomerase
MKLGTTTLVATLKNEGPYLWEWVAYHKSIGFDNIVIFQNDSNDMTHGILHEMPFQSYAKRVTALAPQTQIKTSSNGAYFDMPYTTGQVGSDKDQVQLTFGASVKGKMAVTVRCD